MVDFEKFCKNFIVTLRSSHCGESEDMDFLSVVAIAMKLLKIKGN